MSPIEWLVYLSVLIVIIPVSLESFKKGNWKVLVLALAFLLRLTIGILIETSEKDYFTVDNTTYEQTSWLWARGYPQLALYPPRFYEKILGGIFYNFGRLPFLGVIFNSITGICSILVMMRIYKNLCPDRKNDWVLLSLLALYPSSVLWCAINVRDQIHVFFTLFFVSSAIDIYVKRVRLLPCLQLILSCFMLFQFRSYSAGVYAGAIILSFITAKLFIWNPIKGTIILMLSVLGGMFIAHSFWNDIVTEALWDLYVIRRSFAQIGFQDVAQSSFAIDYKFNTLLDIIGFLPYAIVYSFFAPFPWEIKTTLQLISLPEALALYFFLWPTFQGFRTFYRENPLYTLFLVFFVFYAFMPHAYTVSNVGTLFRHRTFAISLFLIFTARGINLSIPWFFKPRRDCHS